MKTVTIKHKRCVLTISYENYLEFIGGVDHVIYDHYLLLKTHVISHFHISPVRIVSPWKYNPINLWKVVVDGIEDKRLYLLNDLMKTLSGLVKNGADFEEVHIHHLKKVNLNSLEKVLNLIKSRIIVYIHDYYSICQQHNLLRNREYFCGLGQPTQAKCDGCTYYPKSAVHFSQISKFLQQFNERITYIFPSETACRIWISAYSSYPVHYKIIPHQIAKGYYHGNRNPITETESLKIAFVGGFTNNKGGPIFKELVDKISEKENSIKLYHFGRYSKISDHVKNVPVEQKNDRINMMLEQLREFKIHIALLLSICPETYSYTYNECHGANIFIITLENSGNIAEMVRKNGNGIVLANKNQLYDFLCDDEKMRTSVNNFRNGINLGPQDYIQNPAALILLDEKDNEASHDSAVITYELGWMCCIFQIAYNTLFRMILIAKNRLIKKK